MDEPRSKKSVTFLPSLPSSSSLNAASISSSSTTHEVAEDRPTIEMTGPEVVEGRRSHLLGVFTSAVAGVQATAMASQAALISIFRQGRREHLRIAQGATDFSFRAPEVEGVSSRLFEIDLVQGEEFRGDVIKVKLNKSISRVQVILRTIGSFGLYWLWTRFCISGARVFEHDARLAVTNRGRVLMWTLSASGGGKSFSERVVAVLTAPTFLLLVIVSISYFTIVPAIRVLQYRILDLGLVLSVGWLSAITSLFFSIFLDNLSVHCRTAVRQFESRDISFVRIFCYEKHQPCSASLLKVTEAQFYFGIIPKPDVLKQALPYAVWDSGVARTGVVINSEKQPGYGSSEHTEERPSAMMRFVYLCSIMVVICAFVALIIEFASVGVVMIQCFSKHEQKTNVNLCIHGTVRDWFTGSQGSDVLTVISHWVSMLDWSLQVICYLYCAGPALTLFASSLGERSAASIRFIVDRRQGRYTEDADFEDHWESLNYFLSQLFGHACANPATRAAGTLGPPSAAASWAEVPGDVSFPPEVDALPFSSWSQVQEMISRLLDHSKNQVRVYTGALAFSPGETVVATYPTKHFIPIIVRVIMVLTCGFEYFWNWYGMRRESAVILTDRRLLEVSVKNSKRERSMKVDMFVVDSSIKYMSLCPPRRMCCIRGSGVVTVSTRCGNFDVVLRNLTYFQEHGARLWHSLAVQQDLQPFAAVTDEIDQAVVDGTGGNILGRPRIGGGLGIARPSSVTPSVDGAAKRAFTFGPQNLDCSKCSVSCATAKAALLPGLSDSQVSTEPSQSCADSSEVAIGLVKATRLLHCSFDEDPWAIALIEGEEVLWGPVSFDEDLRYRWYRKDSILRRPSNVVALTSHRLIVDGFGNFGCLGCSGRFNRSFVRSITSLPLRWVLGFCIEETSKTQTNMLARKLGACCIRNMMSKIKVKTLSNAGSGRAFLRSLQVVQRSIPREIRLKLCFEADKIKELRRWLGHVSLYFAESRSDKDGNIDLVSCPRGWTPR
eukprot:TRINITY_DN7856_c0_g3_i1.p1 TRINITY_DN7856_c0_g3~~TRINITY_DN7856_c0_g3_i1.p1  ORF type:complete len:1026 (-),score=100.33 TRINITY_DN7856_c0_g3_i1:75-3089(-)